ncbi:hypothetical protein A4D02_29995 [Niastella koreensis]|uniref:Secreted protein n=1 Tax=Niastella koreensis TaxID=354356 RepID=A0ABX3NY87_9BACT|nr:hypothetical protein A4D02_29995 [Niastella koreensis]
MHPIFLHSAFWILPSAFCVLRSAYVKNSFLLRLIILFQNNKSNRSLFTYLLLLTCAANTTEYLVHQICFSLT